MKIICAQPATYYYKWQVHSFLESLRQKNLSEYAIVLLLDVGKNKIWDDLANEYRESNFVFYKPTKEIKYFTKIYIPVIRFYLLEKYWKNHPYMEEETVFYVDSDIILTESFDISSLLNDEIIYVSDTKSYINTDYLLSKIKQVKPEMITEYSNIDIVDDLAKIVGINKDTIFEQNNNSGGAQYILKKIPTYLFTKMLYDCISIKIYFNEINKKYFESESKGFQSWCSDMWALLYNLFFIGKEVRITNKLDFAFSTTKITERKKFPIIHNSGVTSEEMYESDGKKVPYFFKGTYMNKNPFTDKRLYEILENEDLKKTYNHLYLTHLINVYEKYKNKIVY